jgi:hypothetical protein
MSSRSRRERDVHKIISFSINSRPRAQAARPKAWSMGHVAEGIEHRVRSQEPESRIKEKSNQNLVPFNYWLLANGFFDSGFFT